MKKNILKYIFVFLLVFCMFVTNVNAETTDNTNIGGSNFGGGYSGGNTNSNENNDDSSSFGDKIKDFIGSIFKDDIGDPLVQSGAKLSDLVNVIEENSGTFMGEPTATAGFGNVLNKYLGSEVTVVNLYKDGSEEPYGYGYVFYADKEITGAEGSHYKILKWDGSSKIKIDTITGDGSGVSPDDIYDGAKIYEQDLGGNLQGGNDTGYSTTPDNDKNWGSEPYDPNTGARPQGSGGSSGNTDSMTVITPSKTSCTDLFEGVSDILQEIFDAFKIVVPILVIGLSSVDFAKAIFGGNDDENKKAQGKFAKRLILAFIFFLLPTLLEFIMAIMNAAYNGSWNCTVIK